MEEKRILKDKKVMIRGHLQRCRKHKSKIRSNRLRKVSVGTCSRLQGDPTRVNNDVNMVLTRVGNSSVNLASHEHCAGVFIGV
jgi:hypothetical protein